MTYALPTLSIPHIPIDAAIVAIFLFIITIDAMRSGAGRATVIAIAFPVSVFGYSLTSNTFLLTNFLRSLPSPLFQTALFVLLFGILFFLIHRMVSLLGATSNGLFFSLLAALSATIITLSMWVQEPVLQTIWHFGSPIETIFSAPYTLLWMLGAYLVLAFVRS